MFTLRSPFNYHTTFMLAGPRISMLVVLIKRWFWASFKVSWARFLKPFLFYCQPFASNYFRFRTYCIFRFWNGHWFWSRCVTLTISSQLAQIITNSCCHKLLYLMISIIFKQVTKLSTYSMILLWRPRVAGSNGNWTACCVLRDSGYGRLTYDIAYLQPDGKCCQTHLMSIWGLMSQELTTSLNSKWIALDSHLFGCFPHSIHTLLHIKARVASAPDHVDHAF